MNHYCTVLDSSYLTKGLALYQSLVRHNPEAVLWVLCMDEIAYTTLSALHLDNMRLVTLKEFEDDNLRAAKTNRTLTEYCWTCKTALPLYLLENNPDIKMITLLDGDLFFFSLAEPIFQEFGSSSILIVPHRFPNNVSPFASGSDPYNSGFVMFRNDPEARRCLEWWQARALEWCYYRREGSKFGEQGYVSDWPSRFSGVHVLKHIGANAAPWNISQYVISQRQGNVFLDNVPLIFYHFQGLKMRSDLTVTPFSSLEYPPLSPLCVSAIYTPYYEALVSAQRTLSLVRPEKK